MRFNFSKPIDMSKGEIGFMIDSVTSLPKFLLDGRSIPFVGASFGHFFEKSDGYSGPLDVSSKNKSRKITSYFPLTDAKYITNSGDPLLGFDWIISVDTSYTPNHADGRCCTGIVMLAKTRSSNTFLLMNAFSIEFCKSKYPPEKSGWILAIESLTGVPDENVRVGVIVDYDLGNIEAYNSREYEVVEGYTLPEYSNLIYASADFKNDNLCNRLMWLSDILSKEELSTNSHESEEIFSNFFREGRVYKISRIQIRSASSNKVEIGAS